jgi:hypothetical protein
MNNLILIAKHNPQDWKMLMTRLNDLGVPADARRSKALVYACKNNNTEMAEFLVQRGALPKDRNSISLYYAIKHENKQLAALLISKRAHVFESNEWLRSMIAKDVSEFKKSCILQDYKKAVSLLQNGCIPKKELMASCLSTVIKIKNIDLLKVLIFESSFLDKTMSDDWLQETRLFDDCPICLNEKIDCVLPCGHYFHSRCISKWKCQQNTCPLCKQKFQYFKDLHKN